MTLPLPTSLEAVVLESGSSKALLAPERGGMVTRFFVGERPVLFLDEATLVDRTKNVRGGNPVLFPSPGRLAGDRFARGGKSGAMGQHGFARNEPWDVVERSSDAATLRLSSNERTRAAFPWDFAVTFRHTLKEGVLRVDQRVEAESDAMPFAIGFHPYFFVPAAEKARASIPTTATRAWDNVTKKEIDLPRIDLSAGEVDLHLVDHGRSSATLALGDGRRVELRGSDHFRRWVVWTLPGRDFVCLEPWSAPADALNGGQELLRAAPGAPVELWLEIALV
jgi:galactose mutarotase-like enzyme